MNGKILLVEDETIIGEIVRSNLQREGFNVQWAQTGEDAVGLLDANYFDAVLLDVMLPGIDGYEVARHIRKTSDSLPILMLTAKGDTASKVKGLEIGADDYLTKPFELAELLARIGGLLRRSRADRHLPAGSVFNFDGDCWINFETQKAKTRLGEAEITLKEKEAKILALLIRRQGEIVTRTEILEEVWGMDAYPTERTVDNFIVTLRKMFETDPAMPTHIFSVRGRGYRFER